MHRTEGEQQSVTYKLELRDLQTGEVRRVWPQLPGVARIAVSTAGLQRLRTSIVGYGWLIFAIDVGLPPNSPISPDCIFDASVVQGTCRGRFLDPTGLINKSPYQDFIFPITALPGVETLPSRPGFHEGLRSGSISIFGGNSQGRIASVVFRIHVRAMFD